MEEIAESDTATLGVGLKLPLCLSTRLVRILPLDDVVVGMYLANMIGKYRRYREALQL